MERRFPQFSLAQLFVFLAIVAVIFASFPLIVFMLAVAAGALALLSAVLVAATLMTWFVIAPAHKCLDRACEWMNARGRRTLFRGAGRR